MKKMDVHPAANIFPMMADDELNDLASDIKANGLMHPIVTDESGLLIDGRNRLKACQIAGVEPKFTKLNSADPVAFILSNNIARRHMTKGQRAMAVAMIYPEPEANTGRARSKNGLEIKPFPINRGLLSQARTVLRVLPHLASRVLAGQPSLSDAYEEAKQAEKNYQSDDQRLLRLREKHPDLADQVTEERLSLNEAVAASDARENEQVAAEENKREVLLRTSEAAYRGIVAWAVDEFAGEVNSRIADVAFRKQLIERLRLNASDVAKVQQGAKLLHDVLTQLTTKEKSR